MTDVYKQLINPQTYYVYVGIMYIVFGLPQALSTCTMYSK